MTILYSFSSFSYTEGLLSFKNIKLNCFNIQCVVDTWGDVGPGLNSLSRIKQRKLYRILQNSAKFTRFYAGSKTITLTAWWFSVVRLLRLPKDVRISFFFLIVWKNRSISSIIFNKHHSPMLKSWKIMILNFASCSRNQQILTF